MTNKIKIPFALGVAVTLAIAAGGQLTGGGGLNFVVHDSTMAGSGTTLTPLSVKGTYLNTQVLTGSGTYTPTTGTSVAIIQMVGGGGGGGGAAGGANIAAGAGGGAGVYLYIVAGTPGTTLTGGSFSCGAAGTAGANTGGTGGTGGDTQITVGGVTYMAKGATGGGGMTSSTLANAAGGVGQAGSTSGGSVRFSSSRRGVSSLNVGGATQPGDGASSPMGTGGSGSVAAFAAGGAASGFGAGGGGGNASAAGQLGGAGSAGAIVIQEIGT